MCAVAAAVSGCHSSLSSSSTAGPATTERSRDTATPAIGSSGSGLCSRRVEQSKAAGFARTIWKTELCVCVRSVRSESNRLLPPCEQPTHASDSQLDPQPAPLLLHRPRFACEDEPLIWICWSIKGAQAILLLTFGPDQSKTCCGGANSGDDLRCPCVFPARLLSCRPFTCLFDRRCLTIAASTAVSPDTSRACAPTESAAQAVVQARVPAVCCRRTTSVSTVCSRVISRACARTLRWLDRMHEARWYMDMRVSAVWSCRPISRCRVCCQTSCSSRMRRAADREGLQTRAEEAAEGEQGHRDRDRLTR